MKNIKKIIFRHSRIISNILIVCTSLSILSLLAIEYTNHPNSDKSLLINAIVVILVIQIIIIFAINYSLKKTYKIIKKYIEDNSLSYDENFDKITKFVYASKDVLLYNNISSKCSVHLKMVESYKKEIIKVGVNFYTAITFSLKEGLKEQSILFYTEKDYQKVLGYLSTKNIPSSINEEGVEADIKERK